jgi:hypothetical protein
LSARLLAGSFCSANVKARDGWLEIFGSVPGRKSDLSSLGAGGIELQIIVSTGRARGVDVDISIGDKRDGFFNSTLGCLHSTGGRLSHSLRVSRQLYDRIQQCGSI